MRRLCANVVSRWVGIVLSFALAFGPALQGVGVAYASDAPPSQSSSKPGAPVTDAAGASEDSATVVRELTDKRTETASSYLLSDGDVQTVISETPVRLKDDAGAWIDVDPRLVPSDGQGAVESAATSLTTQIGTERSGSAPVTISGEGFSVGMDYLGAAENAKVVIGDTATYLGVGPDATLSYQSLNNGLKETISLASPAAPSTYRFAVSLNGLKVGKTLEGGYALFKPGEREPKMTMTGLTVFDSSQDAAGDPAYCDDAQMTVNDAEDGVAYVTYQVPQAWLSDPKRVFPVKIDPGFTVGPELDTWVSSVSPDTQQSTSSQLRSGYISSAHTRSYLRFDVEGSGVPTSAFVTSADLNLHQIWSQATTNKPIHVGELYNSFSSGTTWNSQSSVVDSFTPKCYADTLTTQTVAPGVSSLSLDATDIVQDWTDQERPNQGFLVYARENAAENSDCGRKFDSMDSDTPSDRPSLVVKWTPAPVVGPVTVDKSTYRVGDLVTATIRITTDYPQDINCLKAYVNGTSSTGQPVRRGTFQWTELEPTAGWDWGGVANISGLGGGRVSQSTGSDGAASVELVPSLCREDFLSGNGYAQVTLCWRVLDGYDDIQGNDIDVQLKMDSINGNDADSTNRYISGWKTFNTNFNIEPGSLATVTAATSASASWYAESAGANDSADAGRGSVELSWAHAPGANAYDVYAFDGATYRLVGNTTATSWSSAGKGLFPSDSWIASNTASLGSGANPFAIAPNGLDLRDDPRILYRATPGTTNDDLHGYYLKVVPTFGTSGTGNVSKAETIAVGLDDRTLGTNDDPRHTDIDLDDTVGGSASLRGDTGALILDATDLTAASYGPAAEVSRHYDSSSAGSGSFGPGWRFNFDQTLQVGSTVATYTDETGDVHRFTKSGSTWASPTGFTGTLGGTGTQSAGTITYPGPTVTAFDTGGRIVSETDRNGDAVTYSWPSGAGTLSINAAASGRTIAVVLDSGGRALSAAVTVGGITHDVAYDGSSSAVTYFPGDSKLERTVNYGYTGSKLSSVRTPQDGNAMWDAAYTGSLLTTFTGPEYQAGARSSTTITSTAVGQDTSVTVSKTGKVNDLSDTVVDEHYDINPTGTLARHAYQHVTGGPEPVTTTTYSQDGFEQGSVEPLCAETVAILDAHGNELFARNGNGATRSATYDSGDRALTSTDENGSTTWSTYDAHGNMTSENTQLNDKPEFSHVGTTYTDHGRVQSVTTSLTATTASTKAFAYAEPIDDPSSESFSAALALGAAPATYTSTYTYDGFGNTLTSTNASGATETSVYYKGCTLSSSIAGDVTTNHLYDRLGRETGRWRSAPGTTAVTGYQTTTYDGAGRVIAEKSCDGSAGALAAPSAVLFSTTHSFDGLGRETTSNYSLSSGLPAKTVYDAAGNVTKSWDDGTVSYDDVRASRADYDLAGNETSSWEPGAVDASATVTSYNPDGTTAVETGAEGVRTTYTYDKAGNEIKSVSDDDGTTTTTYDLAGRATSVTESSGTDDSATTTQWFDLDDRETTASAGNDPTTDDASVNTYNAAGWVLSARDSDGIETTTTYDATGRKLRASTAGSATVTAYDAYGRSVSTTDTDGRVALTHYDAFGRTDSTTETVPSAGTVKQIATTYDSLDRVLTTFDSIAKVKRKNVYPTSPEDSTKVVMSYAGLTTTATIDSDGREKTRATIASGLASPLEFSTVSRDYADRATTMTVALATTATLTATRVYDSAGRLATITAPGASLTYGYTKGKKTSDSGTVSGVSVVASYTHTTDGRLATATVVGSTTTDGFDSAGQLTTVTPSRSATPTVLQYAAGSHLATMTADATGAVTKFGWDTAHGWRTSAKRGTETSVTYTYTASGRLGTYRDPKAGQSVAATYTYDASGQRMGASVTGTGTTGAKVTTATAFEYEGRTLLSLSATATGSGLTTVAYTIAYLYDVAGRPYAGVYSTGATATPFGIVSSDRGDVLALCDKTGATFATYAYDAWGNPLSRTAVATGSINTTSLAAGIASRQPLRYAGYAWDAESGTYYCSARQYDPVTRQFLTKDSAKSDGEESPYQYCAGNPIDSTDPTGLWTKSYHKSLTKECVKEVAKYSSGKSDIAQGDYDVDEHRGGDKQWHFNYDSLTYKLPSEVYENDEEIKKVWNTKLKFGLEKKDGRPNDARYDHFRECYQWAAGYYKTSASDAYYELGMGLHALQDSWAHGSMRGGVGDHARYTNAGRNPDGKDTPVKGHADSWRRTKAKSQTKHWLKKFFEKPEVGVATKD